MLLVEEEAVLPIEYPWSGGAPDGITKGIAQDCRERQDWSQLIYIQVPVRGEQASGYKQGVAG